MFDQAVILAGGRGTRLAPLTDTLPKVMAPVHGHPFLEYQIMYLLRQGITSILLLVGYRWKQIWDYFGDGSKWGVDIKYSQELTPYGTAGCLSHAYPQLRDSFVVIYGDSFLPCDYALMFKCATEHAPTAFMTVYPNRGELPVPNNVQVDSEGYVQQYLKDKPELKFDYVDAGVLLLHRHHVAAFPQHLPSSLEEDIFPRLVASGMIRAFVSEQRFYDIGTPDRLDVFRQDVTKFFDLSNFRVGSGLL
ncbi:MULTISPECIES: sugar phosphate nucleotidyltransferase [Brasilonema]|nr:MULTISPECIES: sugar phosphate nucleotidyltransferase [Brasilonema]